MLLRGNLKLVKDMPPKQLHIFPVNHDSMLDWVVKLQYSLVFILLNVIYLFILTITSPM